MADTLALPKLYADVVAYFAAESIAVPNLFGWRESARQITTGPRIVWIPGDDENGDIGEMLPPSNPGGNPRWIGMLEELFTVKITGEDATDPENELKQYIAARFLFDRWFRAVYLASHGSFAIQSANWIVDKKERRHGATLRVLCTVMATIPDAEQTTAPVDTRAVIDVTELDVTEQFETAPAP